MLGRCVTRSLLALAVFATPAVAAAHSRSAAAPPTAKLTYVGTSQQSVQLTVTAGDGGLCEFIFALPPSVAAAPAGGQGTTITAFTGPGTLNTQTPLPHPFLGFVLNPPLAAGQTATFSITLSGPYPPDAGGALNAFPSCTSGVGASQLDVAGPAASPPPAPVEPKPCKCSKLSAELDPTLLNKTRVPADKHDFGVGFQWRMTCTTGAGGCQGEIDFLPPKVLAGSLPSQRGALKLNILKLTVACPGVCGKSSTGRFQIEMRSPSTLNRFYGRSIALQLKLYCVVGGNRVVKGTEQVEVRIAQNGRLQP